MKIRTDFVTNSSSSSFIVAHNNHFTEEQRNRLVNFALKNFLGDDTCSTEEELVEYFNKMHDTKFTVGMFSNEDDSIKSIKSVKSMMDEYGNYMEEFSYLEDYDTSEIKLYLECLKEIKQGNSVNFGSLDFEDDIPIYTLQRLQKEFWAALKGDNFKTIDDDLDF